MASRALRRFLATESAVGVLLVAATVVALAWANSPWSESYETTWHTELFTLDLRHWVNDFLMALFFLVVAVEVKRELVLGELADPRRAALPVVAAVGGMVVPALLYLALNPSGDAARGWGIPMATDIAFALGVLALVAPRAPTQLRVFLLTLAIVDDIGAIVVIALFYSSGVEGPWLAGAAVALGGVGLLRRLGVRTPWPFVVLGLALWVAVHESGVHATLAGVAMGLMVRADQLEKVEQRLHGWTGYLIVPVFALANAGVEISGAATSAVTAGVVLGLVVGKTVGITAAAWLATRLRLATLPTGVTSPLLTGAAALGGIGFTVSLFITGLAFEESGLVAEAKLGILVASVVAAVIGAVLLRVGRKRRRTA